MRDEMSERGPEGKYAFEIKSKMGPIIKLSRRNTFFTKLF
jgi:hypothetical protein